MDDASADGGGVGCGVGEGEGAGEGFIVGQAGGLWAYTVKDTPIHAATARMKMKWR